jgi:hypothetical protein
MSALLDLDPATFKTDFDQRPFLIGHRLTDHPLFDLTRLVELSQRLPADSVEYNAGQIPISMDPKQTPRTGLGIEETIRRIEEHNSWMVLKFVEQDEAYRTLLLQCLDDVKVHSEALFPGMHMPQGFIFISSANAVTPYHMDPEHNFLLQVHGDKVMTVFNGRDRALLSEEELDHFYTGAHRNMVFKDEYESRAARFHLRPGQGVHVPVTFPHHVRVGAGYSVSFSITFRTPDLDRRALLYEMNANLRRRGYHPRPVGQSSLRDLVMYQTARALRRFNGRPGGAA